MNTKNKGDILAERIEEISAKCTIKGLNNIGNELSQAVHEYRKPWTLGRSVNGFTLGDGQEWHRQDFTEDMLPEGWRPLLESEIDDRKHSDIEWGKKEKDGYFYFEPCRKEGWWAEKSDSAFYRTRRPLPPVKKMVPLGPEDVPPGSVIRHLGQKPWEMITGCCQHGIMADGRDYSFEEIMVRFEISRDNGKTWEPCSKEAK